MRAVGLGIQSFEKIRSNNQFYVDKTPFIGEWYRKNDDITLITRPRRFGKTLTVDMLNCFFSRTYEGRSGLFEGLRIFSDEEMMHLQGTVPTIKLSFAGVKGKTFRELLRAIAGRISILLDGFRYLVTDGVLNEDEKKLFEEMSRTIPRIPDPQADEETYQEFLYKLSHILHLLSIWLFRCHGKKVYIFLDEYDTPIQAAYLNHYYEEAIEFLRDMFAESFKDNDQMARAVITGITRIAKESLFSEMNNLAVYSVMSGGYDAVFGFTEDEMHTVLEEFDLIEQEVLKKLQKSFPNAWFGEKSEFDSEYGIFNLHLGLTPSDTDLTAKFSEGLSAVQHMILTGPIVNVNLYPVEEADLMYSLYTFFNDEQIRIKEGMDVTEEYFNTSISRSYRNDPSQILLMGEIVSTLSEMEDYLRQ